MLCHFFGALLAEIRSTATHLKVREFGIAKNVSTYTEAWKKIFYNLIKTNSC